jgi:tetratricopeptide (TPR) repeat protein
LELDPDRFDEIYSLARERVEPLLVIEQLIPDRADMLVEVARRVMDQKRPDFKGGRVGRPIGVKVKTALAGRLVGLGAGPEMNDAQRHYLQGVAWSLLSASEKAIAEYQAAVRLDPQEDKWHFELALLLKQQGRLSEAYQQALLCNQIQPDNRDYSALLRNIYPENP